MLNSHMNLTAFPGRWNLQGGFLLAHFTRFFARGRLGNIFSKIWRIHVPLKIRIFLWQLIRKRLPTNDNIRRRRGPSNGQCALCGGPEDANHIFFTCSLARFVWSAVRELLHCSWNPSCFADIYRKIAVCKGQTKRVFFTCCAALCWTLCKGQTSIRRRYILSSLRHFLL